MHIRIKRRSQRRSFLLFTRVPRLLLALIATTAVVTALPAFVGADAVASSNSWRSAVSALAGTTPPRASTAYLYAVQTDLGVAETDKRINAAATALVSDADNRFLGDGKRLRSGSDLAAVTLNEVRAVAALTSRIKRDPGASAARTSALVDVVSAAIVSGRTAYGDAARVSGLRPTRTEVPESEDLDKDSSGTISAREEASYRALCAPRAGRTADLLGWAFAHLKRMDAALAKGEASLAVLHAGVAYVWSVRALESLGVKPFSTTADAERDGLPDALELSLGTHPLQADTDADGLTDGYEAANVLGFADPTLSDTDGDGTSDAAEDPDQDTLTTAREATLGTDPLDDDTDNDTLRDADEVAAGTNPTVADSDGDGLLDGPEVRAGLDPLSRDSDNDGTPDGQESVDQPVTNDLGVGLRVRSVGDLASAVDVRPAQLSEADRTLGAVGDAVELDLPAARKADLQQARLSLPVPPTLPSGTQVDDLRVFTFDEGEQRWVPTGSDLVVDAAGRTVSVTITHFSRYAIFDIRNWQQQWTSIGTETCTPGDDPLPADVALVIDSSGSMAINDPQGLRRTSAVQFVDALTTDDRASVVDFDTTARVLQTLTNDKAALRAAIGRIDSSGSTDIGAGVSAGLGALPDPSATRVNAMVLLTDGDGGWNDALIGQAVTKKVPIFTIGLGTGVNSALLQRIARETRGQFYAVSSADQLPQVFRSVAGCVNDPTPGGIADPNCGTTDTDADGLVDCVETGGFALGNGTTVRTDPANEDTDGDNIPDGQEAGAPSAVAAGATAFTAISDPVKFDTDGDGLTDSQELDQDTDAWFADSDSDGLADLGEQDAGTDPGSSDTDGDGLTDGYEVDHVDDEGLSPLIRDERVSKWDYVKDFVQGAVCGDITWSWIGCAEEDSIARLAGNVIGSFIPLVDIRDILANLIKADVVGVVLSLVGLIPAIGDAVGGVAGKIGKFVGKFPNKLADVSRWVARSGAFSGPLKRTVLRAISSAFRTVENFGYDADDVIRIVATANIDDVANAVNASVRSGAVRMPWAARSGNLSAARVAELRVQQLVMPGIEPGWAPVVTGANRNVRARHTIVNTSGRTVYFREDDIRFAGGLGGIEVKSGQVSRFNRSTDLCRQAERDRFLLDENILNVKVWHFVPSASRDRFGNDVWGVGPSAEVLGCLQQFGISFVIHIAT